MLCPFTVNSYVYHLLRFLFELFFILLLLLCSLFSVLSLSLSLSLSIRCILDYYLEHIKYSPKAIRHVKRIVTSIPHVLHPDITVAEHGADYWTDGFVYMLGKVPESYAQVGVFCSETERKRTVVLRFIADIAESRDSVIMRLLASSWLSYI